MFNGAITKNYTSSFELWTTERRHVNTGREFQPDIGSASNINALFFKIAANQKTKQIGPGDADRNLSNKRFGNATFDNVSVKKHFAEIDGPRYPKDTFIIFY